MAAGEDYNSYEEDEYEDEEEESGNRAGQFQLRLLFALLGAFACLLAASGLELIFRQTHLAQNLDDRISRVLIIRGDLSQRLEEAGGRTGEVQVSLSWNNKNDLDLACIDPRGEAISFQHRHGRTGGNLDVDSNSGEKPLTFRPVENIVWPYGRAPVGLYRVFVNHYAVHGGSDPTRFKVSVVERGHPHEITGEISHGQPERLVYQFNTSGVASGWNGLFPAILRAVLLTGLWTAVLGLLFALTIAAGQSVFLRRYYRERFLPFSSAAFLVAWGALAGLIAGAAGQLVFSLLAAYVPAVSVSLGRYIGWVILGGLFGWLMARRMPNLPPLAALFGGLLGGLWGAILFLMSLQTSSGGWGRLEAAALTGAAVGFMIVLAMPYEEYIEPLEDMRIQIKPLRLRAQRGRPTGSLGRK